MPGKSSTFTSVRKSFAEGKIPHNLYLVCSDRVISDELLDSAFTGFVGNGESKSDSMPMFSADDLKVDSLMNECMGGGLFSTRKLVIIRNPKKLTKPKRLALTEYLSDPNPDVCIIFISDEDEQPEKTVLESKDNEAKFSKAARNISRIAVEPLSEEEMISWIRERFGEFEISDESVMHLLSLSNSSLGEILPEIEKLKTFCHFRKSVSVEDINLCNGISKDFSEADFLRAVFTRDISSAFAIYSKISLKKEIEVYLVFLLSQAFCAIKKLADPATGKLQGFQLQRELKLWGPVQGALLPLYIKASSKLDKDGLCRAFDLLYTADKKFKSSSAERSVIMSNLIHGLCSI